MATAKTNVGGTYGSKSKKRKGIHSKKKSSKSKNSKLYGKRYVGQG